MNKLKGNEQKTKAMLKGKNILYRKSWDLDLRDLSIVSNYQSTENVEERKRWGSDSDERMRAITERKWWW